MLTITVFQTESYNEETQEFVKTDGTELSFEHSLVSLSKWEQKYERPFLGKDDKTGEELLDYMRFMCVTPNPPGEIFQILSKENLDEINDYISRKMTGTTFPDAPGAPTTRETISAELIYYWMTAFGIPFETQYWHLNRLFALIRVCNIKQDTGEKKKGKVSKADLARQRSEMNAQRKKQLNTTG